MKVEVVPQVFRERERRRVAQFEQRVIAGI
jgi:hypothetical protein